MGAFLDRLTAFGQPLTIAAVLIYKAAPQLFAEQDK